MKIPPNVHGTEIRSQKLGQRPFIRCAVVLACLCIGIGLLLPTIIVVVGNYRAMPKNQLQADARTLVAAVHYLFEAEPDLERNAARFNTSSPTFVQRTNDRSSEGFSNQTTHSDVLTNPPAQT